MAGRPGPRGTAITERVPEFIHFPWFLRGALTEIIGDGKLGKSLVLLSEIARLSHDHEVAVVAAEDAADFVIRPRPAPQTKPSGRVVEDEEGLVTETTAE